MSDRAEPKIVGGTCEGCGLPYAVGGPHLVDKHCVSKLREALEQSLAGALRLSQANKVLKNVGNMAWLVVKGHHGGQVTLSAEQQRDLPRGAGWHCEQDPAAGTRTFTAVERDAPGARQS